MKITQERLVPKDRIDIANVEAAALSPGYHLIVEHIKRVLADTERQLRTCGPEELRNLQAQIHAFERVLKIPAELIAQMRSKLPQ